MDAWKKASLIQELEKEEAEKKANEIPLNSKGEETDGYISEARLKRGKHLPLPSDMLADEIA